MVNLHTHGELSRQQSAERNIRSSGLARECIHQMTIRSCFEKSYPSERPELLELLKKFKCIIDTSHYRGIHNVHHYDLLSLFSFISSPLIRVLSRFTHR